MRDPVRIAFVLHVMQVAGAEMLVADIVRRLGPRLDPTIICLDGVGQLGERMKAEGVPVISLGRSPGLNLAASGRLARELQGRRIQVVHAHQYTPFFYSALAKVQMRPQPHLIFTEHGRHYPDVVTTKRRLVNRFALARLADEVTGVCAFSAKSLTEVDGFGGRDIQVIQNGIDVSPSDEEPRRALRARLGLRMDRKYVICVARFHPVKDHATLLRAFADVATHRPDTDLLLAGDGALRPELEQCTKALGLTDRVHFLGVRDDVPLLLRAADAFALTSVSEAASLTLLEAMAARLPVVVTAVGGNPEIVRPGIDGLLVPRGDAVAVAKALLTLLADQSAIVRMGTAGRRRVCETFTLDAVVEAYYQRYAAGASKGRHA